MLKVFTFEMCLKYFWVIWKAIVRNKTWMDLLFGFAFVGNETFSRLIFVSGKTDRVSNPSAARSHRQWERPFYGVNVGAILWPYQEHPQQQHQHDMHGCLCAAGGTCVSMAAFGSATSGGVAGAGSDASVGVPGLPGGVNRCLAVHGGDPPCDPPTGSPLSIGTSTLICGQSQANGTTVNNVVAKNAKGRRTRSSSRARTRDRQTAQGGASFFLFWPCFVLHAYAYKLRPRSYSVYQLSSTQNITLLETFSLQINFSRVRIRRVDCI